MSPNNLKKIAMKVAGTKHSIRTAGKIEFVKDTGPIRRDIRVKDFDWSPECLRNLAKILWASQRAHSYAISAYRLFSKMPSAEFSPDGMLGGRGYIQNVKDMRSSLAQAVEMMSSFTDTVHDEVNAEHWKSADDIAPSVQPMVDDAEQVKENPEQFVAEEFNQNNPNDDFDDEEPPTIENPDADDMNPQLEENEESDEDEDENDQWHQVSTKKPEPKLKPKAELPTDESKQEYSESDGKGGPYVGSLGSDFGYTTSINKIIKSHLSRIAGGPSAIPQSDLSGPRVEHVGPGEDVEDDGWASDDPMGDNLGGGVNNSDSLTNGVGVDGVTGDDYGTNGGSSVYNISARIAGYSWLPGADNNKLMPYYDRGVSAEDEKWMRENNKPDMPVGVGPQKPQKPRRDKYWEALQDK